MKRKINRDNQIINFISEMGVASFTTLRELFFKDVKDRASYKVMHRLCDYGEIENERHYMTNENIYWIPKSKPKQLKHNLLRSEFYKYLSRYATIVKFECEFTFFDGIRPDALVAFEMPNKSKYIALLEVEISNNAFNTDKYIKFYDEGLWNKYFENFPIIFIITNKNKIKKDARIRFLIIDEEFSNMEEIIKKLE